jgi:hypothetical protein
VNNLHYELLVKMLTNADGVFLTPSARIAIRWAISMIDVLGDEIPEVLASAAATVEASEEWRSFCGNCGGDLTRKLSLTFCATCGNEPVDIDSGHRTA